jgi:predicted neuraminidase
LFTSPFFNISTLLRSPAVSLEGGGFLLPVYYELTNKFPEALEFDKHGKLLDKIRMTGEHGTLQACLVPVSTSVAFAYQRNRLYEEVPKLRYQKTSDGGLNWTAPTMLDVPNLDSPVAAVRLSSECFLMAYNPTYDREVLNLAVSRNGIDWHAIKELDYRVLDKEHPDTEFSYPTLVVTGETIDLIYTYHRQGIRHYRFNTAWLKEQWRD